jgi:hypothetical protein
VGGDPTRPGRDRSAPDVGVSRDGQARLTSRPTVGGFGRSRRPRPAARSTDGFLRTIVDFLRGRPGR